MSHQEELAHALNAYHAAPESEKLEHSKRVESILEKFSLMDLASYILTGPRATVFVARHSESLTPDQAASAAKYISGAEAKTFSAKVSQE